jgi:hypothetical protein
LYDNDGYYHGPAYFSSRKEAEDYLELYNQRIEHRNVEHALHGRSNNFMTKLSTTKIFKEDRIPSIGLPMSKSGVLVVQSQTQQQQEEQEPEQPLEELLH